MWASHVSLTFTPLRKGFESCSIGIKACPISGQACAFTSPFLKVCILAPVLTQSNCTLWDKLASMLFIYLFLFNQSQKLATVFFFWNNYPSCAHFYLVLCVCLSLNNSFQKNSFFYIPDLLVCTGKKKEVIAQPSTGSMASGILLRSKLRSFHLEHKCKKQLKGKESRLFHFHFTDCCLYVITSHLPITFWQWGSMGLVWIPTGLGLGFFLWMFWVCPGQMNISSPEASDSCGRMFMMSLDSQPSAQTCEELRTEVANPQVKILGNKFCKWTGSRY